MNRQDAITTLIEQVQNHPFHHLYRNRRSGHQAQSWSGGLSMYSLNNEYSPNPAAHFQWLQVVLRDLEQRGSQAEQRVQIANQILQWGGMNLVVEDQGPSFEKLNQVIQKAKDWALPVNAPMNCSWTKVAAVFGCHQGNTIWDSRVSTAVCFRLAQIFLAEGGYVAACERGIPRFGIYHGQIPARISADAIIGPMPIKNRMGMSRVPNLMREIADQLNLLGFPCLPYGPQDDESHVGNGSWNAWKVNMIFLADDVVLQPA